MKSEKLSHIDRNQVMITQKSFNEAESIIQTGLFRDMARPNPRKDLDIDFLVSGSSSYDMSDIKTPVSFFDTRIINLIWY